MTDCKTVSRKEKSRRRRRRGRVIASVVVLALLVSAIVILRVFFTGPRLADLVASKLNARIRGHVSVESIEWPLASLPRFLVGGYVPLEIEGLEIRDEFGDVVLAAKRVTAELDVHPAMFGRHDLHVRDLKILDGSYALIKEVRQPYPVHEYDRTTISLASAFYPKLRASFRAGISASSSPVFDLADYEVRGATLDFEFRQFSAHVEDARGTGFLRADGSDPMARRLYYSLTPRAPRGRFVSGPVAIDLVDVVVERLAQLPSQWPHDSVPRGLAYQATARTSEGAEVHLLGALKQTWLDMFGGEHDVTLTLTRAGKLAERLTGGVARGPDLAARVTVAGPVLGPKVSVRLDAVDLALAASGRRPPLDLHLDRATAAFDMATDAGYLEDTVAVGAGGELRLSATFQLDPSHFDLHVQIPRALDIADYLPARARRLAGTRLSGKLHASGNQQVQRLDHLDLRLGSARVTGGATRTQDGAIRPDRIHLELGKTRVSRLRGVIDAAAGKLELAFDATSSDLDRWLARLGAPPLATGMTGSGRVGGSLLDPSAGGQVSLRGVPLIGQLNARLRYGAGAVRIDRAESPALGGSLTGSGVVVTGRRPRLVGAEAHGAGLDLSRLPGLGGLVTGKLDVDARASGPIASPDAEAVGRIRGLTVAGDDYRDTQVTLKSQRDGRRSVAFELQRAAGGVLSAQALVGGDGELSGAISLRRLPLEAFTGRLHLPLGGQVDAELQLGGRPESPTADGHVEIARGWFRETFLGSASLEVERVGPGQVRVTGQLFQGKVEVDGLVSTRAPYRADLGLVLRRVELDQLLPNLSARYGARGWLSGEVRWRGNLKSVPGQRPTISADLTEAVVVIDNEDAAGRPAPIRLLNRTPLALDYDGRTLSLRREAVLHGPAGDFAISGSGGAAGLDFRLSGNVAVAMLAPYVKRYFEDVDGTVGLSVHVTGQTGAPRVSGVVQLSQVALRPVGQDAIVRLPGGKIEFTNDQMSLTGLSMVVVDEFSDERSELTVSGGVKLRDFRPVHWAIHIDGELSGKMLLVVAPNLFSAGSGSADLSIGLMGEGSAPNIDGSIEFDTDSPLTLTPRRTRREIALTGGSLKFTDKLIELERIAGTVDDEGQLIDVSGRISLASWRPVDVDLVVTADDLPFRVPQTLELSLSARGLRVVGGANEGLRIQGALEIVDGRYVRKFSPILEALRPQRVTETSTPFYSAIPLVGRAQLDLAVSSRAFYVKNNVADIEMGGDLRITGTPLRPRFEGVIRVEQGSFKFQGVRARFERTRGTVNFSRFRQFPDETPTLDIRSESDYRDISGQSHLIQLVLRGPLGHLDWDLSTNTGLNKAQTFTLIFAGRTPDEARQALLGEEPIGKGPGQLATTDSTAGTIEARLVIADQLLKQLAGEYLTLLVEDSIRNVTTLDVARLEVGAGSLAFHGEKELLPGLRAVGDVERSLRGWSWDARGQYRLNDSVSVEGGAQQKRFDEEAEEDVSEVRLRMIWRKVLLP
ncbi:MAG TPA: translocation/assembly module TamB domain-containing protein [Kofleriaceae bacterium]|nr:translocation/assembly module TamB domain-containing protein [Kofleriaceae bacterium]